MAVAFTGRFLFDVKRCKSIPKVRLAATDAGVAGLHGKTGAVIVFDGRTVVVALFAFAAVILQTAGFVFPIGTETVDGISVGELRTSFRIQRRE